MMKKLLLTIKAYISLKKIPIKKNELILICPAGIGDTYFICALAEEISKKYKTHVSLLIKKNHLSITNLFRKNLHNIYIFDNKLIKHCKFFARKINPGGFFYAYPSVIFYPQKISFDSGKLTLLDTYKKIFKISTNKSMSKPHFKKIKKNKKRIKKVFIAPESFSTKEIDKIFWQNLFKFLDDRDYKLLINSNKKEYLFKKCNFVYPLGKIPALIENANFFISIRSGLCDLASETKTKKIILYNNHSWYDSSVFEISSFKKMGIGKNIKEIIYQNNKKTISKIAKELNI